MLAKYRRRKALAPITRQILYGKSQFILQSIMSTNTSQPPKRNRYIASSVIFSPSSESYRPPILPFQFNTPNNIKRQLLDNGFRNPFTQNRNTTAQSLIIPNPNDNKPKMAGLSKLDSMARHIVTQAEEITPGHSSISQNQLTPATKNKKQGNPFASQIITTRNGLNANITNTFPEQIIRKRIQSVGIETFNRQGILQQNLRFLQRMAPVAPEPIHIDKHNDCQSTNSGSGNQLLKNKNFNFFKKRKDQNDPNGTQSMRQFQPFKKGQHMWPLSISPMQQKSSLTTKDTLEEPASASKLEYRHHNRPEFSLTSNFEFKKKKVNQVQIEPKRLLFRGAQTQPSSPVTLDLKNKELYESLLLKNKMTKPQRQITIQDFQLLNKLGKGAFGQVYMAQQKNLGFMCVIKKMSKKRIKQSHVEQHIIREIKLQSYLNNGHCTSLYGYFHDQDYLYLILELLPDGSLQQVKKKRKLPQKQTAEIVRQVALGLKYMHEEYLIHRDLKPQNIFMNQGYVKIGDFGCSIYHNQTGLRNTIVGCLEYSSPQQLNKEGYTDKIDSWSLGILTYEVLFGKSPFQSDIKKIVMNAQTEKELSDIVFPSTPAIKQETKQFILNLLQTDPDLRMDMDQVLDHAFLREEKGK